MKNSCGTCYIGTSGYSYDDWRDVFYPHSLDKKDFLPFYAEQFPFVELNFSYYKQPDSGMLARIAEKTPSEFLFTIKGHKSFTHERNTRWKDEALRFKENVLPLVEKKRIPAVVLQFPYSFHYTPPNRRYLADLSTALHGLPLCVEFRNNEWLHNDVYDGLRERGIGFVATDAPSLPNLPTPVPITTSEIGYLRFHGRNAANWWEGDNTTRYDYLYSKAELHEWLDKIVELLVDVKVLFVAFNNHRKGQAVENGRQLAGLLEDRGIQTVRPNRS